MNIKNLVPQVCLMGLMLLSGLVCKSDTKVPCLIFSGNAESKRCIDLSTMNRITFGENSMIVSSPNDKSEETVELLYSLFHHLEIGEANPDPIDTGAEEPAVATGSSLFFDSRTKLLHLQSSEDSKFAVGVFNISGQLMLVAEMESGDALTMETLSTGVYVAVATDNKNNISYKFIIN